MFLNKNAHHLYSQGVYIREKTSASRSRSMQPTPEKCDAGGKYHRIFLETPGHIGFMQFIGRKNRFRSRHEAGAEKGFSRSPFPL